MSNLRLDLGGEGDESDEGGHKVGVQHSPVEYGPIRGAAAEAKICLSYTNTKPIRGQYLAREDEVWLVNTRDLADSTNKRPAYL